MMLHVGTRYSQIPSSLGAWRPQDLGAALIAWWSADDHGTANMTDDGAGLISAWADRIGGVSVTAATTARPTWTVGAFNGAYGGLSFDGSANAMTTTSLGSLPVSSTGGELWAVADQVALDSDGVTTRPLFRYGANTAGQYRSLQRVISSSQNRFRGTDGTTSLTHTGTLFLGRFIGSANFEGTTLAMRSNGAPTSPASTTIGSLNTGTTRLRIGADIGASPTQFWHGVVRHFIVTAILGDKDRERLEGWLAWDSGLTSLLAGAHPYRSKRP